MKQQKLSLTLSLALVILIIGFFSQSLMPHYLLPSRSESRLAESTAQLASSPSASYTTATRLYPVLVEPFTKYSSTIYIEFSSLDAIPVLSGNAVINGDEASGYFEQKLVSEGRYSLEVSLFLSPDGTNQFQKVVPISGRAVNGLFDYVIDTTAYSDGQYTLRIILEDEDTGISGTLDEHIIIDNSDTGDSSITGSAVSDSAGSCKCKSASMNYKNGQDLYHNDPKSWDSFDGAVINGHAGPFSRETPIKNPKTGVVERGLAAGTAFSTFFNIEGNPALCKEGQGIRSTADITVDNGRLTAAHLVSGYPNSLEFSKDIRTYAYAFPVPGDMESFVDDGYHSPYAFKSHTPSRIIMTDAPNDRLSLSSYPRGYTRSDHFLSEVIDSEAGDDGITRKCRCFLDHALGNAGSNLGVRDQKCVSGVPETCGNKRVDRGEDCDDGNLDESDACSMDCKKTFCGDGRVQDPNGAGFSEECDDGKENGNDPDGDGKRCSSSCELEVKCGNNWIPENEKECNSGEECTKNGKTGTCNNLCKCEYCGDSIINQFDEECDPPATNSQQCFMGCMYGWGTCQADCSCVCGQQIR